MEFKNEFILVQEEITTTTKTPEIHAVFHVFSRNFLKTSLGMDVKKLFLQQNTFCLIPFFINSVKYP